MDKFGISSADQFYNVFFNSRQMVIEKPVQYNEQALKLAMERVDNPILKIFAVLTL